MHHLRLNAKGLQLCLPTGLLMVQHLKLYDKRLLMDMQSGCPIDHWDAEGVGSFISC